MHGCDRQLLGHVYWQQLRCGIDASASAVVAAASASAVVAAANGTADIAARSTPAATPTGTPTVQRAGLSLLVQLLLHQSGG